MIFLDSFFGNSFAVCYVNCFGIPPTTILRNSPVMFLEIYAPMPFGIPLEICFEKSSVTWEFLWWYVSIFLRKNIRHIFWKFHQRNIETSSTFSLGAVSTIPSWIPLAIIVKKYRQMLRIFSGAFCQFFFDNIFEKSFDIFFYLFGSSSGNSFEICFGNW